MKKIISFWQHLFGFCDYYQNIKITLLLFSQRFVLLILDLNPEAATRGVLHKKLLLEIL